MKTKAGWLTEVRRSARSNPSIVGISTTLKDELVQGQPSGKLAIRIYVERKLARNKVPKDQLLPDRIRNTPVDVVELGKGAPEQTGAAGHVERYRPLQGGISAVNSHLDGDGTLGYFVRDRAAPRAPKRPQWYILSCAHVLNAGTAGRETIQPSNGDDGGIVPTDWVGAESLYTYDQVDAAIAQIDACAAARIVGLPTPVGTKRAKNGMTVAKSGRTTGVTYGTVIDADFDGINLPYHGGAKHSFRNCILIENRVTHFTEPGDSGSLVMDPVDQRAVGLHFYGFGPTVRNPVKRSLAAGIGKVLRAFPRQMMVLPGEHYP